MNLKQIILSGALLALVFSCKKTLGPATASRDDRLTAVVGQLRDSMAVTDFSALDTSHGFLTTVGTDGGGYMRIPFRGVPIESEFVLAWIDAKGKVLSGSIVGLTGFGKADSWVNGSVTVRSLKGSALWSSDVRKGYILSLHPDLMSKVTTMGTGNRVDELVPDPSYLPEVVVVGYLPGDDDDEGISVGSPYMSLAAVSPNGGPSTPPSGYGAVSPSAGGGVGAPGSVSTSPGLTYKAEYTNTLAIVNLAEMFNCMGNNHIPDAGATYTVSLCVDVPVNDDPTVPMEIVPSVSAGHTFFVMTKSNGGQSVTQAFGFYPVTTPGITTMLSSVPSAIKDNGGHEINAMITEQFSAAQFQSFKTAALFYQYGYYNLVSSNCSTYGVEVWNSAAHTQLASGSMSFWFPNAMGIPQSYTIKNSPQGLYADLSTLQAKGTPGIRLDLSGNLVAPMSEGECPN